MAVPAAPTSLLAIVVTYTRVDLSWTDNSSTETGFRVERSLAAAGVWSTVGTVLPNAVSYSDITPIPTISYDYRVIAFNGDGDSTPSNVETVTTPVPPPITLSSTTIPSTGTRNTLDAMEISFLSAGVYGLERDVDGTLSGFKY